MKKEIARVTDGLRYPVLSGMVFMMHAMTVYASGGGNHASGNKLIQSAPVRGLINLMNDFKEVLIAVEAVLVIVLCIAEKIKEQAAEPEEAPKHRKKMKEILVGGIIIGCATGLIPVLLSYFG